MKNILKTQILYSLTISLFLVIGLPRFAQAQTVIRDSEIEAYLSEWFTPIFKANDMQPNQVKIILVQSNEINAFVAGGSNIFFYTGLIDRTDNPDELIGVMAHELGHISGGHLVRGRAAMERASYESIIGTIIGVGAAVATGNAGAAGAGSLAANSVAERRFLSKARTFESTADQAAIKSMNRANISPEGLMTFLEKLEGEEFLPNSQQSEYIRSHPLTRNRIESVQAAVEKPGQDYPPVSEKWTDQHARMKAKLMGFINPEQVAWKYDDSDQSVPANYARAVAYYRQNQIDKALNKVNALISQEPNNPYFYELKGQMLFEFGRIKESLPAYQKAIDLLPQSGLIRTALAHAQIENAGDQPKLLNEAIENLNRAAQDEPRSTEVQRLLATAYGRQGKDAYARLHLGEEALLQGKMDYAKQQATTALKGLPENSASALRAKDIIAFVDKNK
ncbi:MAG: M48 family metalloprotease [Alphaproteobacteria bacterium]|nr:M48 family metalloprotease [Alphaproteobacteria bacterium]